MKKITDKTISRLNPQTIVTIGMTSISYKLPERLDGSQLSEISRICLAHPMGKALSIFDEKGKLVYGFSVEQSIF